ncbi:protein sprouty homolog 1-like [Conger conger]|uniref:protein sprouty homolog 1-like n=1 Tax=Conger conger TaxID=82655 RepID=UPI002A599CE0|nr:protein sprouty homolog 1-like [Conger conger]XP_061102153.1 protein sprouty homolog 1-like [Conger conger]
MELQSAPGGSPLAGIQPRLEYDRELQRSGVLSLEQIRALRCSNEYTEGPSAPRRPVPRPVPRLEKHERTHEIVRVNVNNNYERRSPTQQPLGSPPGPRVPPLSRSASSGSSSSASSEQGLLGRSPAARANRIVRSQPSANRTICTQPKPSGLVQEVLKPLGKQEQDVSSHRFVCEQCGRCKCVECAAPRPLPSCLACGGQCLCSAQSLLEQGTCMCLVKGLFYHCSSDDAGESCSDRPCSLSRSHCASRFLCMGLLSAIFPCLLCYPPARACLAAGQSCYDRAKRPGCRCKNSNTVYCKLDNWSPQSPQKPS